MKEKKLIYDFFNKGTTFSFQSRWLPEIRYSFNQVLAAELNKWQSEDLYQLDTHIDRLQH